MSEFRPLIVGIILAGLFAYALISGGILLSLNNGANHSIGDEPTISAYKESLKSNLEESYNKSNASYNALSSSPITLSTGNIIVDAIGGVWKVMTVIPISIWTYTIALPVTYILGDTGRIVALVLGSLLILTIIFAVWKWIATGEGG